ncbi:DUF4123 domain-containing protein [Thalassospira sp. MCCC 1A01428]|uniref:DUF4123 domain-containing protein n=1 Tax=Thalassospira sp. MCCC 1A01428 TaxID=1470575 RepID=UPI000A1EEE75|nr:DUF4123 domain-containing protein [Thalassospira sp. MCCC 1A01428]OSQ43093.1 hypothetical protein THS27_11915 [Thalassospira sp. MCCC 1A01428]
MTLQSDQKEFQSWLGTCRFSKPADNGETVFGSQAVPTECKAVVAIWADSEEQYLNMLSLRMERYGYGIIQVDDIMPAPAWMVLKARDRTGPVLARQVSAEFPFALDLIENNPISQDDNVGDHKTLKVIVTNTLHRVEPLDAQFGVFPRKTLPEALTEWFFGPATPNIFANRADTGNTDDNPSRLYTVLDAGKIANLGELLSSSGLEYQCLFNGKTANELAEVAPYLVKLEDNNSFTRQLFSRGKEPWFLWDRAGGIFIRTAATLTELRKHLRKFTRINRGKNDWVYFRFWDGPVLNALLRGMESKPSHVATFTQCPKTLTFITIDPLTDTANRFIIDQKRLAGAKKQPVTPAALIDTVQLQTETQVSTEKRLIIEAHREALFTAPGPDDASMELLENEIPFLKTCGISKTQYLHDVLVFLIRNELTGGKLSPEQRDILMHKRNNAPTKIRQLEKTVSA